ncbi:flagellar basal-body rod protein FlgC [Desulfosarcina alkanivorans]|uniref:Flagellar basal-body rod protein FlgC n=1 Tax=Desulfosarcina alkanivorans TaxID=571177 RepID=A0A5K7YCT7_9BACT|nr:flagellar basal body rod protein FlgC [Desulfosarcina alkanivorans]BBO66756.1 flagellar basal-body rod protein FlgC [Desulfosarcina alkanivorans]
MNFLDSLAISATGLSAQRLRMNLISSNMANVNTTRTETGEPYKRRDAIFEAVQEGGFQAVLDEQVDEAGGGVKVSRIVEDNKPFVQKYDPGHPDADENGYIQLPNVNIVEEMVNMISASRSFEANATAVRATKDMASLALEIGKSS